MGLRTISGLLLAILVAVVADNCGTTVKSENSALGGTMTSVAGAPINSNLTTSLNKSSLRNILLMESAIHLVHERIPERTVHAKGTGAFGYLEVTNDVTNICKAKFLSEVGKKTKVAVRFSPSTRSLGSADTVRDTRGFAVKLYTEEGNFDIVGFHTPMFIHKDPIDFPFFIHAQKPDPVTNLFNVTKLWDSLTLKPESFNIFTRVFADIGIPDGYRYMPGFSIHTYQVSNEDGERNFIRFHFTPEAGIKTLNSSEAVRLAGSDPDYAIRDLYNAIDSGNYPKWTFSIQVVSESELKNATFDLFDVTREWPLDIYPLVEVGQLVLNTNPTNHFAQVEQLAFNPGNLVPGIQGGPDKLFEVRTLIYRLAQIRRLGSNYFNINVNKPLPAALTNIRDGVAPVGDNFRDLPNYYPNSFNGIEPYTEKNPVEILKIQENSANNSDQIRDFYENQISSDERDRLIVNIVASLADAGTEMEERAIQFFSTINEDFGKRLQEGLNNK